MEGKRLNKFISECGVASRREADRMISAGRVTINGRSAALGVLVSEGDEVRLDGNPISPQSGTVVIAVNKPAGVVCTEATFKGEKNLSQLIDLPFRVFSIGRLDKDSEGLILMTNDGDLARAISLGSAGHEKEYHVTVDKPVTAEFLGALRDGVDITIDGKVFTTRPCKARKTGPESFEIVLTQGMNRQIRRMCEALGYRVTYLQRFRVMNILLGDLPAGQYRRLTETEISELRSST